jgi:hypothetical protein
MRASEVLGREVVDGQGAGVGVVHDLRVLLPTSDTAPAAADGLRLLALVVGPGDLRCRLAYAWGLAQGRARGPWLLRALVLGKAARGRAVPAEDVASWDDRGRVRLRGGVA